MHSTDDKTGQYTIYTYRVEMIKQDGIPNIHLHITEDMTGRYTEYTYTVQITRWDGTPNIHTEYR